MKVTIDLPDAAYATLMEKALPEHGDTPKEQLAHILTDIAVELRRAKSPSWPITQSGGTGTNPAPMTQTICAATGAGAIASGSGGGC